MFISLGPFNHCRLSREKKKQNHRNTHSLAERILRTGLQKSETPHQKFICHQYLGSSPLTRVLPGTTAFTSGHITSSQDCKLNLLSHGNFKLSRKERKESS